MENDSFLALAPDGFRRIAYTRWGSPSAKQTVICLHGLTRNGRDFDILAGVLAERYQVICPDMPGRGRSESLSRAEHYQYPVYLQICAALIAHLRIEQLAWLGTSMGGLIGMMLAAQPRSPVSRLILNDIGALIPESALRRIGEYVGHTGPFETLATLESRLRAIHAPFGPLTDSQWQHLAEHSHWRDSAGRYWLAYDPGIAIPFRDPDLSDVDLWAVWEQVPCPTLVLRGENSDVLLPEVAERMARRDNCERITLPGVGHAPPLMDRNEIEAVSRWLTGPGQ